MEVPFAPDPFFDRSGISLPFTLLNKAATSIINLEILTALKRQRRTLCFLGLCPEAWDVIKKPHMHRYAF